MLKQEVFARTRKQGGMQKGQVTKYRPFPTIDLPDRQWPSRTITAAPTWCSVDLRDGNQALPIPMGVKEKLEMFKLLVDIGFKFHAAYYYYGYAYYGRRYRERHTISTASTNVSSR